jgi:hypothetical protein
MLKISADLLTRGSVKAENVDDRIGRSADAGPHLVEVSDPKFVVSVHQRVSAQ